MESSQESSRVTISEKARAMQGISQCIICGEKAEYCMRGLPRNTYCPECAEAYFGFLEYLDKMNL